MMIDFVILMSTMVWILLWRGLALWYSSRNKNKFWYVINLIDPVAVLPILYLFIFSKTPLLKEMEKWGSPLKRTVAYKCAVAHAEELKETALKVRGVDVEMKKVGLIITQLKWKMLKNITGFHLILQSLIQHVETVNNKLE